MQLDRKTELKISKINFYKQDDMETKLLNNSREELFTELTMSEAIATEGGKMTDHAGYWISSLFNLGGVWVAGYLMER